MIDLDVVGKIAFDACEGHVRDEDIIAALPALLTEVEGLCEQVRILDPNFVNRVMHEIQEYRNSGVHNYGGRVIAFYMEQLNNMFELMFMHMHAESGYIAACKLYNHASLGVLGSQGTQETFTRFYRSYYLLASGLEPHGFTDVDPDMQDTYELFMEVRSAVKPLAPSVR